MVRVGLFSLAIVAHAVDDQMLAGALVKMPTDGLLHFEDLREVEVPVPSSPVKSQVRVQVAGSSVNPVDWKLITSDYAKQWSYPHIFGRDCAGTVVEVGPDVMRLKVGDAVWADNSAHNGLDEGCYAEYVLLEESITALAPKGVPLAHSAVLPLVGLTGLEAMYRGGLPAFNRGSFPEIVVLGGSGGVGHVTLQIARALIPLVHITTTCGTSNVDFCDKLGANRVIDYHKEDWQDVVKSAKIIFDTVGIPGTAELAYKILEDGGSFITIAGALAPDSVAKSRPSVKQQFFLTDSTDYRNLDTLAVMVEEHKLYPVIDQFFSTSEIAAAFNYSAQHRTVGKSSVVPSSSVIV